MLIPKRYMNIVKRRDNKKPLKGTEELTEEYVDKELQSYKEMINSDLYKEVEP